MSTLAPPISNGAVTVSHSTGRTGRLLELDGLRAVAIALVIGCHYQAFASSLWGLPEFGWLGVEIFFVLSGYLITTILLELRNRPDAYRVFYARRARRILPPYFLTIAGCVLLLTLGHLAAKSTAAIDSEFRSLWVYACFAKSLVTTPEIFAHLVDTLKTGHLPSLIHSPALPWATNSDMLLYNPLGPTWSLSVEEWFYILWAPIVLCSRRYGVISAVLVSSVVGFLFRWLGPVATGDWYWNFFCRLDTLALGAALALWLHFRRTATDRTRRMGDRFLSTAGVVAIALLALLLWSMRPILGREIRDSAVFAAFGTPLIGIVTAAAIAWIIHHRCSKNIPRRILRSPALVYVGRRSYTMYLVHVPWYWVVSAFVGGFYPNPSQQWTTATVSLAFTILTAALSWKLIEAPLLARGGATPVRSPRPAVKTPS